MWKFLVYLCVITFSVFSQADLCPQLEGRYRCSGGGISDTYTVSQYTNKEGYEVYEMPGLVLISDDIERELPEKEMAKKRMLRAYCEESQLKSKYSQEVYDTDGIKKWRFFDNSRYYINSRGDLILASDYIIETIGEGKKAFSMSFNCRLLE